MRAQYFFIKFGLVEKKTIDHLLRSTWQAIARMYNEEASKYDSTMATGFALLSIDPKKGTPSTSLGPKMGMEATSLSRTLKSLEEKKLIEKLVREVKELEDHKCYACGQDFHDENHASVINNKRDLLTVSEGDLAQTQNDLEKNKNSIYG